MPHTLTHSRPQLSVNIDHIATIRNARYKAGPGGSLDHAEPDPVRAAHEAELGGADGITVHLREDRRHIRDDDVIRLRPFVRTHFNLEMAATDEMVRIASGIKPHTAMLVPEGRHEVTTEGGLNVVDQGTRLSEVVTALHAAGCLASAFIDPDPRQIHAAKSCGFDICELHTGQYARTFAEHGGHLDHPSVAREFAQLYEGGILIQDLGMRFNAGHALNYTNVGPIAALPGLYELHIGHAIVSRAAFVGLRQAVSDMKLAMRGG